MRTIRNRAARLLQPVSCANGIIRAVGGVLLLAAVSPLVTAHDLLHGGGNAAEHKSVIDRLTTEFGFLVTWQPALHDEFLLGRALLSPAPTRP